MDHFIIIQWVIIKKKTNLIRSFDYNSTPNLNNSLYNCLYNGGLVPLSLGLFKGELFSHIRYKIPNLWILNRYSKDYPPPPPLNLLLTKLCLFSCKFCLLRDQILQKTELAIKKTQLVKDTTCKLCLFSYKLCLFSCKFCLLRGQISQKTELVIEKTQLVKDITCKSCLFSYKQCLFSFKFCLLRCQISQKTEHVIEKSQLVKDTTCKSCLFSYKPCLFSCKFCLLKGQISQKTELVIEKTLLASRVFSLTSYVFSLASFVFWEAKSHKRQSM